MSNIKANHDRSDFELFDGDARVWIEQEEIHMIARDHLSKTDPIELTPRMARELASVLLELADRTDD